MSNIEAAAALALLTAFMVALVVIHLALLRIGTMLRDIRDTISRGQASATARAELRAALDKAAGR